jgi:hypothetical protein
VYRKGQFPVTLVAAEVLADIKMAQMNFDAVV